MGNFWLDHEAEMVFFGSVAFMVIAPHMAMFLFSHGRECVDAMKHWCYRCLFQDKDH